MVGAKLCSRLDLQGKIWGTLWVSDPLNDYDAYDQSSQLANYTSIYVK